LVFKWFLNDIRMVSLTEKIKLMREGFAEVQKHSQSDQDFAESVLENLKPKKTVPIPPKNTPQASVSAKRNNTVANKDKPTNTAKPSKTNSEAASFDWKKISKLFSIIILCIAVFFVFYSGTQFILSSMSLLAGSVIIAVVLIFWWLAGPESFLKFIKSFGGAAAGIASIFFLALFFPKSISPVLLLISEGIVLVIWIIILKKHKYAILVLLTGTALLFFVSGDILSTWFENTASANDGLSALSPAKIIKNIIDSVNNQIKAQIALAKGVPDSTIDGASKKKAGVFPSEIVMTRKPAVFVVGEPIVGSSQIKAQSLDFPITLKFSCAVDNIKGKVIPETVDFFAKDLSAEGDFFDYAEVDCTISEKDSAKLGAGSHTMKIFGDFNFDTRSYISAYFIDSKKLVDLEKRNLVSQLQSQMLPSATTAVSSGGPVKVGVSAGRQLIGISPKDEFGPTISLSVINSYEGHVRDVKDIIVMLPKGLLITDVNGKTDIFKRINCADLDDAGQKGCDDIIMEVYLIDNQQSIIEGVKNPYDFAEFRIHTKIDQYGLLLSAGATILPKKIRASVAYDYEVAVEKTFSTRASAII